MYLAELTNLTFGAANEPLALLAFGIGLVGFTVVLRRMLARHDETAARSAVENQAVRN